ncbi:MAG: hemerythrin domain-containing protein [Sulfitobacter sp.]|nr:hemerythrin domain-containing protein [Sulfitobacter sp.]
MTDLSLQNRTGLPEPLRLLLKDEPRERWEENPRFAGLVSFWLDRHGMFRQLMAQMGRETESFIDRDRDAQHFARTIGRYGGMFVNQLHGHHQIEDHHYFPVLRQKDPRIEAGFDLLDADHHALDGLLNRFVEQANGAIQAANGPKARGEAGVLRAGLTDLERLITRHLDDEEDLIVPVIFKYGAGDLG